MIIDLLVPPIDNDMAKRAGAKWDKARQTWYVVNPEDIYAFSRWIPELKVAIHKEKMFFKKIKSDEAKTEECMTVRAYLQKKYNTDKPPAILKSEAKIFGIKYPLQRGWLDRHGDTIITKSMEERMFQSVSAVAQRSGSRSEYAKQGMLAICGGATA